MDYNIVQYIGKFHPLLVHLPIGILVVAILFGFLIRKENYEHLKGANHIILFFGAISATLACITGYVLSYSEAYETQTISWHQWMGISLAMVSWIAFFLQSRRQIFFNFSLVTMTILLVATGHLGGSITHGSDFITPPPLADWLQKEKNPEPVIQLAGETIGYEAVANIVNRKCQACHGPGRQKGKLRLDLPEHLMAGGKSGDAVVAGKPSESILVERISLPLDDEDHMPPKEKPQLNDAEVRLLRTWIETGASFDKTIAELEWPADLVKEFNQNGITSSQIAKYDYVPEVEVEAVRPELLEQLQAIGLQVLPVAGGSNFLSINFLNVQQEKLDEAFALLERVKEQCIWLDASGLPLDNAHVGTLISLTNLTRLNLSSCGLQNEHLALLPKLPAVRVLNLVDNHLSLEGITQLASMERLEKLFLFQNELSTEDQKQLEQVFGSTEIDFGGYVLPLLPGDTTEIAF